jgi:hypothetical protein
MGAPPYALTRVGGGGRVLRCGASLDECVNCLDGFWIDIAGLVSNVVLNYLLVVVLGWALRAAGTAYDIGWCKDGWMGWSMATLRQRRSSNASRYSRQQHRSPAAAA